MAEPIATWVESELTDLQLGDKRLDRRAQRIVSELSRNPSGSIPQISGSWAATKATYDFLANETVKHSAVVAAQRQATLQRMAGQALVLCVQDTTELNLTRYSSIQGQGWLARNQQTGVFVHSGLAVSSSGVPLGLLDQRYWTRPEKADPQQERQRNYHRPFAEKESYKWLQTVQTVSAAHQGEAHLLFISDAESDIHDYFAAPRTPTSDLLVRAYQNRRLDQGEQALWPTVRAAALAGEIAVELSEQADRPQRTATCQVRYQLVTLPPSTSNRAAHLPRLQPVTLTAILVEEHDAPAGEEGLCWLLLTTCPVDTLADAVQLITFYTFRWRIERFHFVLKSGCRVEQRRLDSVDAVCRFLALANLIAWRLLWLTYLARLDPQAPCSLALEPHEWQPLALLAQGSPWLALQPPSLQLVVDWLARLGGYLARKGDGPPGVLSLWRGWIALMPAVRLFSLLAPPS